MTAPDEQVPESYSRFPRTAAEAFKDAHYGAAIERPARGYGVAWWLALGLCAVVGVALVWGQK